MTVLDGLSSPDATCGSHFGSAICCACIAYLADHFQGDLVPAAIWAFVENAIGIVSACLPTLRPIYNLIVHGHHCSVRDTCSRCQTSTQQKTSEYVTTSPERDSPQKGYCPRVPPTRMRVPKARTPPATYTTPPTTYTTPGGSAAASSDHAGQTFWISGTTESDQENGTRGTPSIEIW